MRWEERTHQPGVWVLQADDEGGPDALANVNGYWRTNAWVCRSGYADPPTLDAAKAAAEAAMAEAEAAVWARAAEGLVER